MSFFVQYHALLTYHQFKYINYSYLDFIVDSFEQKREICHIKEIFRSLARQINT